MSIIVVMGGFVNVITNPIGNIFFSGKIIFLHHDLVLTCFINKIACKHVVNQF